MKNSTFTSETLLQQLRDEGFPHVFVWHDEPGTQYPEHKHQGKVAFYLIKGSVSFAGGISKVVKAGERFDVPAGVFHSAVVGPKGCDWIVGEEIAGDA